MQAGRRYTLFQLVNWQKKAIFIFFLIDAAIVFGYTIPDVAPFKIPWQPISLIGIAVAFYNGFKNNSSYERMWEGRKIWGGIVNVSRSFTVMIREFINNEEAKQQRTEDELSSIKRTIINRHIAWLKSMTLELRKPKAWEHHSSQDLSFRDAMGMTFKESDFAALKPYLSSSEYDYLMTKGNRSSHLLSMQSKDLMRLRQGGELEHFRHLEIQGLLTEMYTLQGKSERIKNFPFPRQYATATYFFTVLLILLIPFGMVDAFSEVHGLGFNLLAIVFSVLGSWVFWSMERIGDYSENPFEGLYNDVPISSMAVGIERDILQMIEEESLPEPMEPLGDMKILV